MRITSKDNTQFFMLLVVWWHVFLGLCLFIDPNVLHISDAASLVYWGLSPSEAGWFFILAALLARYGIYRDSHWYSIFWAVPQQFVVSSTLVTRVISAHQGQYPDGYEQAHLFIAADALPAILLAVGHTMALVWWFGHGWAKDHG